MENKQTAIQKLSEILDNMIAKSLLAKQDNPTTVGYQVATQEIKKYIGGLLLMEKEQIIEAWSEGNSNFIFNGTPEQYYEETYGK